MKPHRLRNGAIAVVVLSLLAGCAGSAGSDGSDQETYTIRYASAVSPESVEGQAMEVFKQHAEEKSDGRLVVELYPGGALGGVAELTQQVPTGAIDMTNAAPSWWQTIAPGAGVIELPYLFTSREQAFEAMDGELGELIAEEMYEQGLVVLGWYDLGFRHVLNNSRPIESVDDIRGLTIRFQDNPTHLDAFAELGANPIVLDWTEVYSSMQQDVVDGVENGLATLIANNLYEVGTYLSLTQHVYGSMITVINRDTWESLPADLQEVVREASAAEVAFQREETMRLEDSALETFEAEGVAVNELSSAVLEEFRTVARSVYDAHADRIGPELVEVARQAAG